MTETEAKNNSDDQSPHAPPSSLPAGEEPLQVASRNSLFPHSSEAPSPTPPFVSAHDNTGGGDNSGDVQIDDVALEETQHTNVSAPKLSRSTAKHNRTTVERNDNNYAMNASALTEITPEEGDGLAHGTPRLGRLPSKSSGVLLNASARALRGSARGDARTSIQFGDLPHDIELCQEGGVQNEQDEEEKDEGEDATWGDVCHSCCCHTPREWGMIVIAVASLLVCLYFFLVGLDLMGTSFQVVGGCTAGSILGEDTNPIASLMIGIIATAILQSSSTTTAIIVSLVSGGLDIQQAIYMVMGANVGTAITSIIVSLGHLGEGDELEKAFAGAVVNFVFKILTTVVLLPLEIATGYLYYLTKAMLPDTVGEGEKWEGPIKKIVSPLSKTIIIANKNVIEGEWENKYQLNHPACISKLS